MDTVSNVCAIFLFSLTYLMTVTWKIVEVEDEFKEFDQSNPNCVVLGDATMAFTYPRLNFAFRLLKQQPGTQLITMGIG